MFAQGSGFAHQNGCIRPHPVTIAPAQQPADRLTCNPAENVPERDIDTTDRMCYRPAAAHPEGIGMKVFADPLRFQGIFTCIERLEHMECSLNQLVVSEYRSPSGNTFIRKNSNQCMDAIVPSNLIGPTTFWGTVFQTCCPDFCDF